MSSNFQKFGTITTDTTTEAVVCSELATLTVHLESGTGTWTWQFKGADGVWRDLYGGADNTTLQQYNTSNMVNVAFGSDVQIRGVTTDSASVVWDWQILSNPRNRR